MYLLANAYAILNYLVEWSFFLYLFIYFFSLQTYHRILCSILLNPNSGPRMQAMHAPLCLAPWVTCDWYFHQWTHGGQGLFASKPTAVEIDFGNEFAL
jgi:hypothetical protein